MRAHQPSVTIAGCLIAGLFVRCANAKAGAVTATNITLGLISWYCFAPQLTLNGSYVVEGSLYPGLYNNQQISDGGYAVREYIMDLSVQLAVDQMNADPNVLPGIHVNIKRFSDCGPYYPSVGELWGGKTGGYASTVMATDIIDNHPDVVGVIAMQSSSTARYSAEVLSFAQIPMCSGSVGSPRLSNKPNYPYFYRTIDGAGIGEHFYQFLKLWNVRRVAFIYQKNTDLGYFVFLDMHAAMLRHKMNILGSYGTADPNDKFFMNYVADSLKRVSARYIIVIGNAVFSASVMNAVGKRNLTGPDFVYLGINRPKPGKNATLLYGPQYYSYIEGYVQIAGMANFDTKPFIDAKAQLTALTGYPLRSIDVDSNNIPHFTDCTKSMLLGFDKLLRKTNQSAEALAGRRLNSMMNYTLFQNPGIDGVVASPLAFNDNGDIKLTDAACYFSGTAFDCHLFGSTDMDATKVTYHPGEHPVFNGGSSVPPPDGPPAAAQLILSINSTFGGIIFTLVVLGLVIAFALLSIIYAFRHKSFMKPVSGLEAVASLLGCVIIYFSLLAYLPVSDTLMCKLRHSLFLLGFMFILTSLLFRNLLLFMIFCKKRGVKPQTLVFRVRIVHGIVAFIGIATIAVWAALPSNFAVKSAGRSDLFYLTCIYTNSATFTTMTSYFFIMYLCLLPMIAILQRVKWEDFNESVLLGFSFVMIAVAYAIITFETKLRNMYYDVTFCLCVWTATTLFLILMFGTRVMQLAEQFKEEAMNKSRISKLKTRLAEKKESFFQRPSASSADVRRQQGGDGSTVKMPGVKKNPYRHKVLCNTVDACIYQVSTSQNSWSLWRAGQPELHHMSAKSWLSLNSNLKTACFTLSESTQFVAFENMVMIVCDGIAETRICESTNTQSTSTSMHQSTPPAHRKTSNMKKVMGSSICYRIRMEFENEGKALAFVKEVQSEISDIGMMKGII
ncbi:Taste receptor type 1 member 3 [Chytriomyces hyalinus]|nr:Taste receptor type 1 member 3 [Chytriomyces hyalinus]